MVFLYCNMKTKPISSWLVAFTAKAGDLLCCRYNCAMFIQPSRDFFLFLVEGSSLLTEPHGINPDPQTTFFRLWLCWDIKGNYKI